MKATVNIIFTAILCPIFLWQAWATISKYQAARTSLQITFHDDGLILFPSVTICKNYMYNDKKGILNKEKIGDSPNRELFLRKTWSKDQMFTEVSHDTVDGTYKNPCITVGGPQMGSPCSFPFVYPDCSLTEKPFHCSPNNTMTPKLYEQCFSTDVDWFSWCYTRTYLNNSGTTHQWGHCAPSCRDEGITMKRTRHNLASNQHSQLWTEHIFNLDTFSNGHCHTYNPANYSFAGRRGQFYAMLGFEIFLHEKGQFWPGLEMEPVGQTKPVYVGAGREVRGSFTAVQRTSLDTAAAPCVAEPGYSLTACMEEHLAARAGCRLDWADTGQGGDHAPCSTWDQIFRYQTSLTAVSKLSWTQLVNETGCHAKCSYTHYSFDKISEESIYWKTLSSSSFYLSAEKTMIKSEKELLAFDFEDLVNGLGGALGLFLGWSLLHIFNQCFQCVYHIRGLVTKLVCLKGNKA